MNSSVLLPNSLLLEAASRDTCVPIDRIKIVQCKSSDGSGKGQNFGCDLRAVSLVLEVEGRREEREYMVKLLPKDNILREEFISETEVFKTECLMYEEVFPLLQQARQTPSEPRSFKTVKCLHSDVENGFLVMENLSHQGFSLYDRKKGLPLSYVHLVLDQLADLHATSFHLLKSLPRGVKELAEQFPTLALPGWIPQNTPHMKKVFQGIMGNNYKIVLAMLEEHYGLSDPKLVNRAKAFTGPEEVAVMDLIDSCVQPEKAGEGSFPCIVHNDTWYSNLMFSEDGSELVFLDHQLSRLSPNPGLDLSFFLSTSTEPALRHEVGLDSLLSHYHSSLLSCLQQLGYNDAAALYSMPQLKEDFKAVHAVGYVLGASHIQLRFTDLDGKADDGSDDELVVDGDAFADRGADPDVHDSMTRMHLKKARRKPEYRKWIYLHVKEAVEINFV